MADLRSLVFGIFTKMRILGKFWQAYVRVTELVVMLPFGFQPNSGLL